MTEVAVAAPAEEKRRFTLPSAPLWALTVIALSGVVIYALIVHWEDSPVTV